MKRRYYDTIGLAVMACLSAGCADEPVVAARHPGAPDAGAPDVRAPDVGAGTGDTSLVSDAAVDAPTEDGPACPVEPARRSRGAQDASIVDDADARVTDVPRQPDIQNVDGRTCMGIDNCTHCRCAMGSPCVEGSAGEATTCTAYLPSFESDECACDCKRCSAGFTCVKVYNPPPSALGGGGYWNNRCFELCRSDADCSGGRVCRRNLHGIDVCADPPCRSDADCTADACGHCVPYSGRFHIGQVYLDPSKAHCVYEGQCAVGSCERCQDETPFRTGSSTWFHLCPP